MLSKFVGFVAIIPLNSHFFKKVHCDACNIGKEDYADVAPLAEIHRFIKECMMKVGACEKAADTFANTLVEADYRGFSSHGLNRLGLYVLDVKRGMCDPLAKPQVVQQCASSALVDGHNALGPVTAAFCMDLAIKKAKKTGIGIVAAYGCNHFGIGASYVMRAVRQGFIGLCLTNTSPLMVPTRAKDAALGTNPIAFGAPGIDGDHCLMVDVATTAVAFGKIDIFKKKGLEMPEGWALDKRGNPTTDPEKALKSRRLLPLGGEELNSGYKGFAFAFMVEALCGILTGAKYGPQVRSWSKDDDCKWPKPPANLGQCFIAVNPNFFAAGYQNRMTHLIRFIRNMEPRDPEKPVLVPGDHERANMKQIDKQGGIIYLKSQIEAMQKLAAELKVDPIHLVDTYM